MHRITLVLMTFLLTACDLPQGEQQRVSDFGADVERGLNGQYQLQGRVIRVADGDSLTVRGKSGEAYRIRLQGIDAPEKKQPHGQQCRKSLRQLASKQIANVDVYKQDRYRRLVGKVIINNTDMALKQITTGCGWHYKHYAREQSRTDRDAYAQAEVEARNARRGLWQDKSPQAPWDYRRSQR